MLKINLSGRKGKKKKAEVEEEVTVEVTEEVSGEEEVAGEVTEVISEEEHITEELTDVTVKEKKKRIVSSPVLVVILLIVAVAAAAYYKKDLILSLFHKEPEVVAPVQPPPPPPEPEVTVEPDPIFVTINRVSDVMPQKLWLTSLVIKSDGTYNIKGISFTHTSINDLLGGLGTIGNVADKNIPKKSKLSETVYNFNVSGVLSDVSVSEILDVIPTDGLVALAEPVVNRSKEFDVKFNSVPRAGQTYSEKDLPFVLEGSLEGLKKVIAELCPDDGDIRVYQMVILPASTGRPYDKVKASFSLRTISSI